jgi:bacteriocin biosynthesis cyclodehydratase domain-containing protein
VRPGPRLRPGLAVTDTATGPLIIGATRRYHFSSATTASLVARLLPLLDGNHDVADLSAECSVPAAEIERLLDKLRAYGLLEVPGLDLAALSPQVATYFARMLSPAAQRMDAAAAVGRLREADILLSLPRVLADAVTSDLLETGVGTVIHHEEGKHEEGRHEEERQAPRAAVIFGRPDVGGSLTRKVSALSGRGTPVLRCAASDGWIEIGPVFYPGYTACPGCFERGYQEAGWCPPLIRHDDQLGCGPAADLLGGLIVREVLALLTGLGGSVSPRVVTRVNVYTFRAERYLAAPDPDCEQCGWPQEREAEPLAMYYEWQMEKLPARLLPPRIFGLAADRQHQPALAGPAMSSHLPRCVLPADSFPDRTGPRGRNGQLDDRLLAHLLTRLGDLAADAVRLELYLLTRRHRLGVPGTVCRYDRRTREVLAVSADSPPAEVLLAGSDLDMRHLDLAIAFVGEVGTVGSGQETPVCRDAHLLAGRCAAALWAMASSFRLHASYASRWPDSLAEVLELRPDSEAIAALAGLGAKRRS